MDITSYVSGYNDVITQFLSDSANSESLETCVSLIKQANQNNKKTILVGNGGSAAIAEHMAVDLTKNAGVRATTISGTPMLTTIANDYGYDYVFSKGIEAFADAGDVLIAISSGGSSANILNAVKVAKTKGLSTITFSGFDANNPLRQLGDINFWVDSKAYGYVELFHNFLIHYINDKIIGKVVYKF